MKKVYLPIIFIGMFMFLVVLVSAQKYERKEIVIESITQEGQEQLYQIDLSGNIQEQPEFDGYIIQLKEVPLVVQKKELERKAAENERSLLNPLFRVSTFVLPIALEPTLSSNVQEKYEFQRERLLEQREKFEQDALQALDKRSIYNSITGGVVTRSNPDELVILGEYKNTFNGIALNITTQEAKVLRELEDVVEVYPNYLVNITLSDSIPLINADNVWLLDEDGNLCADTGKTCLTGEGITIGIIDTGVDYTHPDLGGCSSTSNINDGSCSKVIGGYDFYNNDNNPIDDHGHGTHVAATAAGNGTLKGVAPNAKIYAYKVLSSSGSGPSSNIIAAIERSVDPNQDGNFEDYLDIISLSLGGPGNPDDPTSQAIDNVVDAGIVAIVAAGNSGPSPNTIGSPGAARKAITVGATTKLDSIAPFSSRGPVVWSDVQGKKYLIKPDVTAPGVSICAAQWDSWLNDRLCNNDNKHIAISGTSMATPHVAGAVALIKQAHPDWTPIEIKTVLRNTAIDIGEPINTQGYGRIDVLGSVNIQNKPPIAILETPVFTGNIINILGTASGENFLTYSLYHGSGLNPVNWILFHSSSTSVSNGMLYPNFDPSSLTDGEYTLRLVVEGIDGQISEDRTIIIIDNLELTYPQSNDIYRLGDTIDIIGTISGTGFQNYVIEYGGDENPTEWYNLGISLENNGLSKVTNSLLGTFDSSVLSESGFYTIKLTFNYESKQELIYIRNIYFDSTLKEGWPRIIDYDETPEGLLLWGGYLEPIVSDLNNDGFEEIIIFVARKNTQELLVYNFDGSLAWSAENAIIGNMAPPIIGDINNDGFNEIIVYSYDSGNIINSEVSAVDRNGKIPPDFGDIINSEVYAFDYEGNLLEGWNPAVVNKNHFARMLMADLDLDGDKEIIIRGDTWISIIGRSGQVISQWIRPYHPILFTLHNSPAVGNFDEDAELEIVVVSHFGLASGKPKVLVDVYNMDGTTVDGWPVQEVIIDNSIITSSPVVGDINNDGFDEIIVGLSYLGSGFGGGLYAYDKNGNILPGWPKMRGSKFVSTPALGDIDGDGDLEIAVSKKGSKTYLFHHDGTLFSGWPQTTVANDYYSTIIADINNDGFLDIITTAGNANAGGGVYAWNSDGTLIEGFPKFIEGLSGFEMFEVQAPATVADIDNDGKLELIASSNLRVNYESQRAKNGGALYVWELNSDYNPETMPWPMFMHDPQHTGYILPGLEASPPPEEKEIYCADSDGGKNYDVAGSTFGINNLNAEVTVNDTCITEVILLEYYCTTQTVRWSSESEIIVVSEQYLCPNSCQDGACTTSPQPKDNYYVFQKETAYDPTKVFWGPEGPPPSCLCDINESTKDCPDKFKTNDDVGTQCGDYYRLSRVGFFGKLIAGVREYVVEELSEEQKCSDGTSYNQCSSTKPEYCLKDRAGNYLLIDNCSGCGCPTGDACQTDGTCLTSTALPYTKGCSDGTSYNQCSSTKPEYCLKDRAGNYLLIDNCSGCGCPTGDACQTDGTCLVTTTTYFPR